MAVLCRHIEHTALVYRNLSIRGVLSVYFSGQYIEVDSYLRLCTIHTGNRLLPNHSWRCTRIGVQDWLLMVSREVACVVQLVLQFSYAPIAVRSLLGATHVEEGLSERMRAGSSDNDEV